MKIMRYIILLLVLMGCNKTTDPTISQLSRNVTALKTEVNNLSTMQAKLASKADLTKSTEEVEKMKASIVTINKLLTAIETRIDAISLPDTVKQFIGNGNVIYNDSEEIGNDTVNIVINDTVSFKIWKGGGEVIKK